MIAVKYTLFAIISTLFNLLAQYLSFRLYDGFLSLYLAMALGTGVGLISKYLLDKKYIFYQTSFNSAQNVQRFSLYSLTGVITTLIFWGVEISFNEFFRTENAKYYGAVIGLSIGYTIKYFLDKKYVFKN